MQHLEVSGVVRTIYGSLGVKRLSSVWKCLHNIMHTCTTKVRF